MNPMQPTPLSPMTKAQALADPQEALLGALQAPLDLAEAKYKKLGEALSMIGKVEAELGPLVKLGDLVSLDDVIPASGRLVAAGLPAPIVAGMMSEMPAIPVGIAAWLRERLSNMEAKKAELLPARLAARHEMGVAALKVMAGASLGMPPQFAPPMPGTPALRPPTPMMGV